MESKKINPTIKAIVSIRHLALGITNKWSNMKKIGNSLDNELASLSELISKYGTIETKQRWESQKREYLKNLDELKKILANASEKIKAKSTDSLTENWNTYHNYSQAVFQNLNSMKEIGKNALPENSLEVWKSHWDNIYKAHDQIKHEAEACSLQLQLIEQYKPEEINELTDTILKHIPLKYSVEEAEKYHDEYVEAYEAIKKEASQKKNLWDRFLDILAGGMQQTPAQRVMMQRWVNGEKGGNIL